MKEPRADFSHPELYEGLEVGYLFVPVCLLESPDEYGGGYWISYYWVMMQHLI